VKNTAPITVGGTTNAVKTIICMKGQDRRFVTSANPVCPSGYTKQ
jgi:hypothetical protein